MKWKKVNYFADKKITRAELTRLNKIVGANQLNKCKNGLKYAFISVNALYVCNFLSCLLPLCLISFL